VPTLNRQQNIGELLIRLKAQDCTPFETIVVDRESSAKTAHIAKGYGARVAVSERLREVPARFCGAQMADGEVLLFTGADVTSSPQVLGRIAKRFATDSKQLAIAGPGIPVQPPLLLGVKLAVYSLLLYFAGKLPGSLKRFSSSINLLPVRSKTFHSIPGDVLDSMRSVESYGVDADRKRGRNLSPTGRVQFLYLGLRVYVSSRCLRKMGFIRAKRHVLFVIEDLLPIALKAPFLKRCRQTCAKTHPDMRKGEGAKR